MGALKIAAYVLLHVLVGAYFVYATYFHAVVLQNRNSTDPTLPDDGRCHAECNIQFCNGYGALLLIISFVYIGLLYYFVLKPKLGSWVYERWQPFGAWWHKFSRETIVSLAMIVAILLALVIFFYFETKTNRDKLTGITAPCLFILAGYVFSTSRKDIPWRFVITGVMCQFLLGLICIRWKVGRHIFQCLGEKVATFMRFSEHGSRFVFGDKIIDDRVFAFAILPVIFFFSFFISILYYLGTMQWVVLRLGWILQKILGTTVCESVTAAANIFLGMSESAILIRPYISLLTASEMHTIMVSGFATVSGTVLAAYMSFGARPAHLIASSVMAAPATLAISKLFMPETEESKTSSENIQLEKSEDASVLAAATNGANQALRIILGTVANIVAYVAFAAFLNGLVNWMGYLIGWNEITFEWMLSTVFTPLAWAMGVPWEDCPIVAKVMATKTIINEFVAYERLGEYLECNMLGARSAGIATFAICGFANPGALGILIGSLQAMAPTSKDMIVSVSLRAFVVGSIVCFISASFAGLVIPEHELERLYREFFESHSSNDNKTLC